MSKTIEQLRAEASTIEEATRQGENTQLRVGGLFQDIIDFIAQIPISETILGPLLQALNNSGLINPGDGQTLTFSLMKDGWTFSDALTQFQLKLGQITSTVTSNYEAFIQTRDMLQREVEATDQRVRNYKTDYDNSQIEYATWKSQTDTSISQYAVAIDKVSGDIISISGRVDTAYDQLDFVTNNLEAADKAIGKIFDLAGMNLSDEPSASWLYKNKDGIYGAAATFDADGNIKDLSKLSVTIDGIETEVSNATGQISYIRQSVDEVSARVSTIDGKYSDLKMDVNSISATVNDPSKGIGALNVRANSVEARITTVEGKTANMGIYVTEDELLQAQINADQIVFHSDEFNQWAKAYKVSADNINWVFTNAVTWTANIGGYYRNVMQLDNQGNLTLTGKISADTEILDNSGNGTSANYLLSILNTLYNGFSATWLEVTYNGYALSYANGAVQAFCRATSNYDVYLPTLGDFQSVLKKSAGQNFSCQLTLINQTVVGGSEWTLGITGGSHSYDAQITNTGTRPRIYRGSSETKVGLAEREVGIFFITYINRRFLASFILA